MSILPKSSKSDAPSMGPSRALLSGRNRRRFLLGVAVFVTVIGLFYTGENWRGKRAWEAYEREAKARGKVLDWKEVIPPPIPDELNIFKAPNMQSWFSGRTTTELSTRISFERWRESILVRGLVPFAEVSVVPNSSATSSPS